MLYVLLLSWFSWVECENNRECVYELKNSNSFEKIVYTNGTKLETKDTWE